MSAIVNLTIHDNNNLGDLICPVANYWEELSLAERFPVPEKHDIRTFKPDDETRVIIIGGGGVLHDGLLAKIEWLARRPRDYAVILWGCGLNLSKDVPQVYHRFMDECDLVGLRDYGNPWHYVPCPSCLHPEFDKARTGTVSPHVAYDHHAKPIPINGPHLNNSLPASRFGLALDFIASGKIVFTSSYHGAYWGMLLNRTVVVHNPPSNRFHFFEKPPKFCKDDCVGHGEERDYSGFLESCRKHNRNFASLAARIILEKLGDSESESGAVTDEETTTQEN